MRTIRSLLRRPIYTATAVISFALAVGANTAIFSIVNALWLRPLPVHDSERLVVAYRPVTTSTDGGLVDTVQRRSQESIERLNAFDGVTFELNSAGFLGDWNPILRLTPDGPNIPTRAVSYDYFQVLGVPVRGRTFRPEEDEFGATAVAIVSRGYWRRALGATSEPVGTIITTTRGAITVVGVLDSPFAGARLGDQIDIWIPLGCLNRFSDVAASPGIQRLMPLTVIARLGSSTSVEMGEAQIRTAIDKRTTLRTLRDVAFPLRAQGDIIRQRNLLVTLWSTAVLVLILGCANLSSLFLVRSEERRHEFAVRLSLGSSPGAVTGLVLTEALVLTAAGLLVGLGVRGLLLQSIRSLALPSGLLVGSLDVGADWRVAMFGTAIAGLSGLIATVPALRQARSNNIGQPLARGGRTATPQTLKARQVLLASHVAISLVLLVGALTVTLAIVRGFQTGFGFDTEHTLLVSLRPRLSQYLDELKHDDSARRLNDYNRLLEQLRSSPGVIGVTYGPSLLQSSEEPTPLSLVTANGDSRQLPVALRSGGPGYLTVLGAQFLAGRDLNELDAAAAVDFRAAMARKFGGPLPEGAEVSVGNPTAVVDSAFATALWPGVSPLGQRFTHGFLDITYEVVGVIKNIRHGVLEDANSPTVVTFLKLQSEAGTPSFEVVLRVIGPMQTAIDSVRAGVHEMFPDPSWLEIRTAGDVVAVRTARQRMTATIMSWYAAVSAALALVGMFGLVAHIVGRSKREIGTRAAFGATTTELRRLLMLRALKPVAAGLACGVLVCFSTTPLLRLSLGGLDDPGLKAYASALGCFVISAAAVATLATRVVRRMNVMTALGSD